MWQVTVLGQAIRSGCNFPSPEDAAVSCQLFKHYLQTEFRLQTVESLGGEQFSTLAYRRSVILSDSQSVFKSLTETAKLFLAEHRAELDTHRESNPESIADKFRRSGAMDSPAIREWVNALDSAEQEAKDFAAINGKYFLTLMNSLATRSADILKPLALAIKLHEGNTSNPRLAARARVLTELQTNLHATEEYVRFITAQFTDEESRVASALQILTSNRPPLV